MARWTLPLTVLVALASLIYVFADNGRTSVTEAEARAWLAAIHAGRPAAEAEALFRGKRVSFERLPPSAITASIPLDDPNAPWYANSCLRVRVTVDKHDRIASVEAYRFTYGF
jgi:hypothetical protein